MVQSRQAVSVVYPGDYALMEESSVRLRTLAE
nr:MAG TPA: hypothetical protein [Caudoviricetes sp.]